MSKYLFAFTLSTTREFGKEDSFFSEDGQLIGRTLAKRCPMYEGDKWHNYDIESTPEIFEKLNSGALKLASNVGEYHVSKASMNYISEDK